MLKTFYGNFDHVVCVFGNPAYRDTNEMIRALLTLKQHPSVCIVTDHLQSYFLIELRHVASLLNIQVIMYDYDRHDIVKLVPIDECMTFHCDPPRSIFSRGISHVHYPKNNEKIEDL